MNQDFKCGHIQAHTILLVLFGMNSRTAGAECQLTIRPFIRPYPVSRGVAPSRHQPRRIFLFGSSDVATLGGDLYEIAFRIDYQGFVVPVPGEPRPTHHVNSRRLHCLH